MRTIAPASNINTALHRARVMQELKEVGVASLGLWSLESRYLPRTLHADEHIAAVIYGYREADFMMLIATGRRIIYLDKQPLDIIEQEIHYNDITGLDCDPSGFGVCITLHTKSQDYVIQALNPNCTKRFVRYIEHRLIENNKRREC